MTRLRLTVFAVLPDVSDPGRLRAIVVQQYGSSSGIAGRTSLNGFGALRRSYEQAGYPTRDVYRLTNRVARTQVIVWTPQVSQPIAADVTNWFDRWLRRGGRTLVYIAPDSGSETQYWEDASRLAPPDQRLEYRRRLARSRSQRMQWTINRQTIPSNGWFVLEPSPQRSIIESLSGPWDLNGVANSQEELRTEYRIVAYDPKQPGLVPTGTAGGGTGPGSPGYVYYGPTVISHTKVNVDSWLDTQTGDTMVAQVTSPNWKDSKIIVVSGGSLLTNYAFTRDFGVQLAATLVAHSALTDDGPWYVRDRRVFDQRHDADPGQRAPTGCSQSFGHGTADGLADQFGHDSRGDVGVHRVNDFAARFRPTAHRSTAARPAALAITWMPSRP